MIDVDSDRADISIRYCRCVLRVACCLFLLSGLAHAAPTDADRRDAEAGPPSDEPHRQLCSRLARLGRADEAVAECEAALSLAPGSPYDKLALAYAITQTGRDLARGLALANEALPEVSGDPIAVGMYCGVLLDLRTRPGIDPQLDDCIKHLYVLDPGGAESNYLGALVAALRGHRDLAHHRLEVAKQAGLPDAEYTQLAAEIDGRAPLTQTLAPAATELPRSHGLARMLAVAAGIVGMAALVLAGVRLSRRRRR